MSAVGASPPEAGLEESLETSAAGGATEKRAERNRREPEMGEVPKGNGEGP